MSLIAPIVYLRYTDGRNAWVRWHQVWNRDLFIETQRSTMREIDPPVTVSVIDETEYRRAKWPERTAS